MRKWYTRAPVTDLDDVVPMSAATRYIPLRRKMIQMMSLDCGGIVSNSVLIK